MLPVPGRCHPTADSCCPAHLANKPPQPRHPKSWTEPPKAPKALPGAPPALAELLAPPRHGGQCKHTGWFKNWRQGVTAIQSKASKEKTQRNARLVSAGKLMSCYQNLEAFGSTRSTRLCHPALKNNTRGWGTGGCCQRLHPQRRCSSSTAWGAQRTEKSAESISPAVDALHLAA